MSEKSTIKFYPVGNGDTTQIITSKNKRIIIDFNHREQVPFNLAEDLRKDLAGTNAVDVLVITHMDEDHIGGFSDFFYLNHANKYQDGKRIKIKELWVPASVIIETGADLSDNQKTLRAEARYRIKEYAKNPAAGKSIRIFSLPKDLKTWLEEENIDPKAIDTLFITASERIPETIYGPEIFCHTPFYDDTEEDDIERNECSIVLHFTFKRTAGDIKFLAIGDMGHEAISRFVIKSFKNNIDKLQWDIFAIPHHCSYTALAEEKGTTETKPVEPVEKLLKQGQPGCYMIASCEPIPNQEQTAPPHFQAKNCYKRYLSLQKGIRFLATMEEPTVQAPKPIVFDITDSGIILNTGKEAVFPVNPKPFIKTEPTRNA